MQTNIDPRFAAMPGLEDAERVLRSCVHCGFCNATCPTYLELGDERDGPRGRIYLIKQLLEGGETTAKTQTHLDRCLTCRNCETTCPSGVEYGKLLDFGRGVIEREVGRSARERLVRWLLRRVVTNARLFGFALALARLVRPALPISLRGKIPGRQRTLARPGRPHKRTMLVLEGCAQKAATPATNSAAARVLDKLGIALVGERRAGCCGALSFHLGEHEDGLRFMRRNIDAWWPHIERGVEAIVTTASGCGATVRDYGHLLRFDADYADKAARVSALTRDLTEVLRAEHVGAPDDPRAAGRIAVHCPCTLQHAQQLPNAQQEILERAGFELTETREPHLCCGSAGSYSILQPELATRLRDRKLAALTRDDPDLIVTANVGCQLHLASGSRIPVRHWIELLDESCAPAADRNRGAMKPRV